MAYISDNLKKKIEGLKLKNGQEMAYASLIRDGWNRNDALVVLCLDTRGGEYVKDLNERVRDALTLMEQQKINLSEHNLLKKEGVLAELQAIVPTLDGKERADVLMKIADLQQMKKDDVKEEETVHFYMQLKCPMCPAYMMYQNYIFQKKMENKDFKPQPIPD